MEGFGLQPILNGNLKTLGYLHGERNIRMFKQLPGVLNICFVCECRKGACFRVVRVV